MKLIGRMVVLIIFLFALSSILGLGYLGLVPYLSDWLKTNQPRNLGTKYTKENLIVARAKSNIVYDTLPSSTPNEKSISWSGSHKVDDYWTAPEITALMNNRPWKNWPFKNVQVKFNSDGTAEISGVLVKNKLSGYASTISLPKQALNIAMKVLPMDPVFYLKMKAAIKDNRIKVFEPQSFQIGRVSIPTKLLLSYEPIIIKQVRAEFTFAVLDDLKNIRNKKDLIVFYLNTRLSSVPGFYANEARIEENKLIFKGTLPDKELMVSN